MPTPNFVVRPFEPPTPSHGAASHPAPAPRPSKPRKDRRKLWIILGVVAFLIISLIPAGIALTRAGVAALAAKRAVQDAQTHLKALDVTSASDDLTRAQDSLSDARTALQGVGFWRDMPVVGTQLRALEDAASAGQGTLDSAVDVLRLVSTVVDALRGGTEAVANTGTGIAPTRSFTDLSIAEKRDLLRRLNAELPQLRLARDKMDLALAYWNRVPQDKLAGPVRDALKPLADTIPQLQKSLNEIVPIIEVVVPMAGYPNPHRYLLALQNSSELRPGGGFIGTIGTMTWDAGELSEFLFTDVYNVDNPVSGVWKETPPAPIQKYLGLSNWFLRDANWSPDFSVSGERILDFYTREVQLQLHAPLPHPPTTYIALEPGFFANLLRLTGPIAADGDTFTADNFFDKLEHKVEVEWHQRGIPVEKRKEIISKLGDDLAKKLFALPASRWPEILDLVTLSLERKQIVVYSREADLQALFDTRGWSGRTRPTAGDFLWVVDANLAALKTDLVMKKTIAYRLDATNPAGPTATVTLRYQNAPPPTGDYRFTRYRTYTRVYVPEGSQLISSNGAMKDDLNKTGGKMIPGTVDVFNELGKTVFGAFWSIEPGKIGELSFTYRLPSDVATKISQGSYRMDWMKQVGIDNARLTLDLLFGKKLKTATPSEDPKQWGDSKYELQMDSLVDRQFEMTF